MEDPEDQPKTMDGYLRNLVTRLHKVQNLARENLIRAKERSKRYYDRKIVHRIFKIGNSVYLLPGYKIRKFRNHYLGPFAVSDTYQNGNVKLKLGQNKFKIIHPNRIRKSYLKPRFPISS